MSDDVCTLRIIHECKERFGQSPEGYCPVLHDTFICWPHSKPNSNLTHPCPRFSSAGGRILGYTTIAEAYASKICNENGTWETTNLDLCVEYIKDLYEEDLVQKVVAYITFIGCFLSLITLILSQFIFCYFNSRQFVLLQLSTRRVHRNLFSALIFHLAFLLFRSSHPIFKYSTYGRDNLCKTLIGFQLYSLMCGINWMFLEGLHLHNRIVVNVFRRDSPFKWYYYIIGWGLPAIIVGTWCWILKENYNARCWRCYAEINYIYIIIVPVTVALIINTLFLVNIIRVLVTRTQDDVPDDRLHIIKAVKATILLFPLLGITNLFFCFKPAEDGKIHSTYHIMNGVVQSTQGLFVGILYCFRNAEVRSALKTSYKRFLRTRNSSRSSTSRFFSQTSHTYVSQRESMLADGLSKPNTSAKKHAERTNSTSKELIPLRTVAVSTTKKSSELKNYVATTSFTALERKIIV